MKKNGKLTKDQGFMLDILDYLESLVDFDNDSDIFSEDWNAQDIAKIKNGIEKIRKVILKNERNQS